MTEFLSPAREVTTPDYRVEIYTGACQKSDFWKCRYKISTKKPTDNNYFEMIDVCLYHSARGYSITAFYDREYIHPSAQKHATGYIGKSIGACTPGLQDQYSNRHFENFEDVAKIANEFITKHARFSGRIGAPVVDCLDIGTLILNEMAH